jgi:hypothetical protein
VSGSSADANRQRVTVYEAGSSGSPDPEPGRDLLLPESPVVPGWRSRYHRARAVYHPRAPPFFLLGLRCLNPACSGATRLADTALSEARVLIATVMRRTPRCNWCCWRLPGWATKGAREGESPAGGLGRRGRRAGFRFRCCVDWRVRGRGVRRSHTSWARPPCREANRTPSMTRTPSRPCDCSGVKRAVDAGLRLTHFC